jgi:hypothetical protein
MTDRFRLQHVYVREGDEIPTESIGWNYHVRADDEGTALHVWYMERILDTDQDA